MGIFVFGFQVFETDRIIPNNCSASRFTSSRDAGQQNLHAKVIPRSSHQIDFTFFLKIPPECCGSTLVTNMSSVLHSHLPLEAADLHN